jgi:hypothetical protein
MFWRGPSLLTVLWIVVGVIVSSTHDYLENLETVKRIVSALLAIILWPLLLLGIDLHVK